MREVILLHNKIGGREWTSKLKISPSVSLAFDSSLVRGSHSFTDSKPQVPFIMHISP